MSSDDDEFAAYDFSEFTDDDLAQIDARLARAHAGPALQISTQDSPFTRFLSWKKYLAVTDLVSPLWCELQHEYSLYGRRYKPLHLRPASFTSRNGKTIRVHHAVAHANDRRLKRGKSVHKALEDELIPQKIVVHPVSEEERFALRLLRLIDGFSQLVLDGITRELPVFAITHAQVVLGVIDEVFLTQATQDQVESSGAPQTNAPCSPPKKRQRRGLSPTQEKVTPHVPDPPVQASVTSTATTGAPPINPSHTPSVCTPAQFYECRILDYKTRQSSSIPLDGDSLSARVQLMMYHRMLSTLLEPEAFDFGLLWTRLNLDPTKPFSAQFLKDIIWEQRRTDPTDCNVHLNRLVSEWMSTVQRKPPGLVVSQQLQIVYRRSVHAGKRRENGEHTATETIDVDDPLEALVPQDERNLARAIEESLIGMGHQEVGQLAQHVAQHVKQAGPSFVGRSSAIWKDIVSPSDSEQTDPTLAWAIQQSLLTCALEVATQVRANGSRRDDLPLDELRPASEKQVQEGYTTIDISPIIGTKEFPMNDDELDARLADVLQWWLGARPAKGVDIGQTNRCFTCEYQSSCEWREKKAREATAMAEQF